MGAGPIFYINLDETRIGCAGDHYRDQEAVAGSLRKTSEGSYLRKLHDTAGYRPRQYAVAGRGLSCHELRIAGMHTVPGEARASSRS